MPSRKARLCPSMVSRSLRPTILNPLYFLVIVVCCSTGHFVVTSCWPSVPSNYEISGQNFALYFLGRIFVYSTLHLIIPDKNQGPYFCLRWPVAFAKFLPPQLPCHCCCCCSAPPLALTIVVVAARLVNCCVATALAIVDLGCRPLDLMFWPFGWWPWYISGHHGPWAMVVVFSQIVLFASTWPEQSYQYLRVTGSHFYP